jgi:nitrogenase molybdenum-iron protein beta chain
MSKQTIHKNRVGCTLHGALKVINAIDGLVPIIHSNPGCSILSKLNNTLLTGNNGKYYSGWLETPSTSIIEKQVVFGGSSRLREQIKNTVKVQSADLFVVLSGCAPEIVGDDIHAMVKEGQEQDFPVIAITTPGFKGNTYKGYQLALKAIIEKTVFHDISHQVRKDFVNILGIIPEQDIFWEGNLIAISELLSSFGLKGNTLLGYGQTQEDWKAIPSAALNIVFSPWGLEAAQLLEKKFGTPYLYIGYVPVGAVETSAFIDSLSNKLSISKDLTEKIKIKGEAYQAYQFQKLAQYYLSHNLQKEIVLVGESYNVLGLARFLHNSFGQLIKAVIITDSPEEEQLDSIKKLLPVNELYPTELILSNDGQEIDEHILRLKPELILGSSIEQTVASQLSIPLIKVSAPVYDKVILKDTYFGYDGALNILQDFSNAVSVFEK